MRATNSLSRCFGKAKMLHLPRLDKVSHRSCHVFDGYVRIDAMLVEQIDGLDFEPLQRSLGYLPDMLWTAVNAARTRSRDGIDVKSELGGDHYLAVKRRERFAQQRFVGERAIGLCRIEERDAAFHSRSDQSDHLLLVCWRTVSRTHSHATEPESRNFQSAVSKFTLLHFLCSCLFAGKFSYPITLARLHSGI